MVEVNQRPNLCGMNWISNFEILPDKIGKRRRPVNMSTCLTTSVPPARATSTAIVWKAVKNLKDKCLKKVRSTKRALLVAIKYSNFPPRYRLKGPHDDVEKLKNLLIDKFDYLEKDIKILTDKGGPPEDQMPYKENIIRELQALLDEQQPGNQHLFYFAGHSFQLDTDDPSEEDFKDECTTVPLYNLFHSLADIVVQIDILPFLRPTSETLRKLRVAARAGRTYTQAARKDEKLHDPEEGIVDDFGGYSGVVGTDIKSTLIELTDFTRHRALRQQGIRESSATFWLFFREAEDSALQRVLVPMLSTQGCEEQHYDNPRPTLKKVMRTLRSGIKTTRPPSRGDPQVTNFYSLYV
ncbi:hypothetical protein H0H93_012395 [Arthromyces matolae]|nr:hypothetical protein H0H93_012395 [Arthromyces matolae]